MDPTTLILWLTFLFAGSDHAADPIQQAWYGNRALRTLTCERLSQADAHERYPAEIPPTDARSTTFLTRDALVCERRQVPSGQNHPQDELILEHLTRDVDELVSLTTPTLRGDFGEPEVPPSNMPGASTNDDGTWGLPRGEVKRVFVDVHYPRSGLRQKIAAAAQVALFDQGFPVHQGAPLLAAGDVEVITTVPPQFSAPLACQRLHAEGALRADDALVTLALLREQESILHVGVCRQGGFTWLR